MTGLISASSGDQRARTTKLDSTSRSIFCMPIRVLPLITSGERVLAAICRHPAGLPRRDRGSPRHGVGRILQFQQIGLFRDSSIWYSMLSRSGGTTEAEILVIERLQPENGRLALLVEERIALVLRNRRAGGKGEDAIRTDGDVLRLNWSISIFMKWLSVWKHSQRRTRHRAATDGAVSTASVLSSAGLVQNRVNLTCALLSPSTMMSLAMPFEFSCKRHLPARCSAR